MITVEEEMSPMWKKHEIWKAWVKNPRAEFSSCWVFFILLSSWWGTCVLKYWFPTSCEGLWWPGCPGCYHVQPTPLATDAVKEKWKTLGAQVQKLDPKNSCVNIWSSKRRIRTKRNNKKNNNSIKIKWTLHLKNLTEVQTV